MSKKFKIINIIVFLTWISLISLLLYNNYAGIKLEKTNALKEFFEKQTYWYDIYAGKIKIGFAKTTFDKAGNEIIIRNEREMRVFKNGQENILKEKLKCLCDSYYSIKSFEYTSHFKDEKGIKVTGEVDHENIIFFLESPEKRKTFKTPTQGRDFYLPTTFIPALVQKNPVSGSVYNISMLDFNNLSFNTIRVELDEIKPIKVGANVFSLYKFKERNAIWWSNERGIVIKEDYPSGITIYSQVEKFAIDPVDRILFDYTDLPIIKSNKVLPDPVKLNLLKLKLKGYSLDPQVYKNSTVKIENDILTIKKEDITQIKENTYTLPHAKDMFPDYLSPDQWVLSNYKPLEDTGRIYAKTNNNDAFQLTRYLTGYLFNLIRTMPMFVLSNSKDFLNSLSGDYLERTLMFPSYSRAAGLPTRLVGGLVYLNGYFYFHTWPEVWFNKWIPVDPTFAQFPADVTHIPLKEGTLKDITSIIKDLQSLNIEILEAS